MKVMKTVGLLLVGCMFCVSAWCNVEPEITHITDIQGLKDINKNLQGHYVLDNDIDLKGEDWKPIGAIDAQTEKPFTGIFDGNNHIISNFRVRDWYKYLGGGFFSVVNEGATIKNLKLMNANVTGGNGDAGGLARVNRGSIVACSVIASTVTGSYASGGLASKNYGTIKNSYATGTVSGKWSAGGLVADNYNGTIKNSYATSNVSMGRSGGSAGGLVGNNDKGTIKNSYATGTVSINNHYGKAGGLVGSNYTGTIERSYATGWVSKKRGGQHTGGLIGRSTGKVVSSYWDRETTGQKKSAGGTGKSHSDMIKKETYVGWAAEGNWILGNGFCPKLSSSSIKIETKKNLGDFIEANPESGYKNRFPVYIITKALDMEGINLKPASQPFRGQIVALDAAVIHNLEINLPEENNVGFFRKTDNGATISNLVLMNLKVVGNSRVGGLVGSNKTGLISGCFIEGEINSISPGPYLWSSSTGGLVGSDTDGIIRQSCASGSVSGGSYVGGLMGRSERTKVYNSYTKNRVLGNVSSIAGLIGGINNSTIINTYAVGEVRCDTLPALHVGGLIGGGKGDITHSYWDTQATGQKTSTGGGKGRTTKQMKLIEEDPQNPVYVDWPENIWKFYEARENKYPDLQCEHENSELPFDSEEEVYL